MIRPLNDQVLVIFQKPAEKIGSIFIPDSAKEKPMEALIVAVGPGRIADDGRRIEPQVKRGEKVLVEKWNQGTEIDIDGVKHNMVRESQFLCVIDGDT